MESVSLSPLMSPSFVLGFLCEAPGVQEATWGKDGKIVFSAGLRGLRSVSANGGSPESLTTVNVEEGEVAHIIPEMLPDGKAVLFTIYRGGGVGNSRIAGLSLQTGERKILIDGAASARYVPTGHLVYSKGGSLLAVPFDPNRLEITGSPAPVLDGILVGPTSGLSRLTFSNTGTLVYVSSTGTLGRSLLWVDRQGLTSPLNAPRLNYHVPVHTGVHPL